ncbi:hypothetical protein ACFWM3_04595 [Gottfriedia sp. NPDC058432]|uniref:hypothetical protein n=1 Tax=Bacillaceae TaxID=186817 RepID=UPI000A3EB572|nr:hypothetical protein [Bacillus sp. FJAT-25509]
MTTVIVFIYITAILVSIFFVGPFAPLVGLAIGIPIHILILLVKIHKKLNEIESKLE